MDDRNLYWDDWLNDAIYVLHKSFKGSPKVLIGKTKGVSALHRKFELKVYYKESQKGISSSFFKNICSNLTLRETLRCVVRCYVVCVCLRRGGGRRGIRVRKSDDPMDGSVNQWIGQLTSCRASDLLSLPMHAVHLILTLNKICQIEFFEKEKLKVITIIVIIVIIKNKLTEGTQEICFHFGLFYTCDVILCPDY